MASSGSASRATKTMAVAVATSALCRFLRTIVLARMLMPEDYGVGATFTLTLTFLDLISDLGPRNQLVQSDEGHLPQWQAVTQGLHFVRSVGIATVIFLLAGPLSLWFRIPDAVNCLRLLSLVPLIRGLEHWDTYRFQRDLKMSRLAMIEAVPALLGLAMAPLFAMFFGDYRAFLALTLGLTTTQTILSHLLAERPYRWGYDRETVRSMLRFGLPLLGNGLLLFVIFHGERFLVGTFLDMAVLGGYSAILALALTPTTMLASLHGSVSLPIFSRAKSDPVAFEQAFLRSAQVMCLAAGMVSLGFLVGGRWAIETVYGSRYLSAIEAAPWLGLMCSIRIARTSVAMASVAHGDTSNAPLSNTVRLLTFCLATLVLWGGGSLAAMAALGCAGEFAAYLISAWLLHKRHGVRPDLHVACFGTVTAVAVGAWVFSLPWEPGIATPLIMVAFLIMLIGVCLALWKELRQIAVEFAAGRGFVRRPRRQSL